MNETRIRDSLIVGLTLVTGIIDAIGFTRLGGVFTSVMTGNMVLLGISAAKEDGTVALHTLVAFAGYIIGSFLGARIANRSSEKMLWPKTFSHALIAEFAFFGIFAVTWEATGRNPSTHLALFLLGTNAIALGIQSAAVLRLGISGLSTTYLTGTLTIVVAHLTQKGNLKGAERSTVILFALIGGAAIGAVTAIHAPIFAPIVQEGLLGFIIAVGWFVLRGTTGLPDPIEEIEPAVTPSE